MYLLFCSDIRTYAFFHTCIIQKAMQEFVYKNNMQYELCTSGIDLIVTCSLHVLLVQVPSICEQFKYKVKEVSCTT